MATIDNIISLAKAKGLKQSYICTQLGLERTWIQNVKRHNSVISDDRLKQIAAIMGTSVQYLKGETDDPTIIFPEKEKSPSSIDGLAEDEALVVQLYRGAQSLDDKKDIIRYMLKHIQPELYAEIVVDALAALNTNSAQQ